MLLGYDELVLYRDMDRDDIVKDLCDTMRALKAGEHIELHRKQIISALGSLVEYCEERGFGGNLWHTFIADRLVCSENTYSLASENDGAVSGSMEKIAAHDMSIIRALIHMDVEDMLNQLGLDHLRCICDYESSESGSVYDPYVTAAIMKLSRELSEAEDNKALLEVLSRFYATYGTGNIGLHRAFVIDKKAGESLSIIPVSAMEKSSLDDLVGYESAKSRLVDNTEAFLGKRPSNNCLLYGDAGTGKSTCIRALSFEYYERGLRLIQVKRNQFEYLSELIAMIRNRNYRFIIYMDDLSFEEFETDYKYLKAAIEGGIESRPSNMLIYATSNRRHIVKETVSDREDRDEDMHRSDTMSEKLSLAQRFGESIFFCRPDKKEFNSIVRELAKREGLDIPEDELYLMANKWEMSHGGLSGRTARQFIDHLLGTGAGGRVI